MEGALDLAIYLIAVARYENFCATACRSVFKLSSYEKLRAPSIDIIDLSLKGKGLPERANNFF